MAQSRADAVGVLADVRQALDLTTLAPPGGLISSAFREVGKKLSLGRGATPYALSDCSGYLCAYGYYPRVVEAGTALGRIDPLTWDLNYAYVRSVIHTAYFFAERAGDHAQSTRLERFLNLAGPMDIQIGRDHYQPNIRIMDGSMLKRPFQTEDDPSPDHPIKYEDRLADLAIADLKTFAPMWIFGGSTDWPRERIQTEVDQTLARLYELPGWQPW